MKLYSMGFTKKSAHDFFVTLRSAGVGRIVDVRLNNTSQLAGFTKKQDLPYLLDQIAGIQYVHATLLAPTQEILDSYKKNGSDWQSYETSFINLLIKRNVETTWADSLRDSDCLLCSEEEPAHCHRRLVAEYLAGYRNDIEIRHIG
jgi:uncharacterized protein (DUF488 family)